MQGALVVPRTYQYLLGDSRREASRLRQQAGLWDPIADALFDRVGDRVGGRLGGAGRPGVRPGMKVLEIGPGQGSLHLELRRRVRGPIDAVERSPLFAAHLTRACRRDGLGPGQLFQVDLLDAPLPRAHYDLIFARWVFLFLPDPLAHLRKLVRALRPGGVLAIQDYLRHTMALVPLPPEWPAFLAADEAFFASQGGDASIGARLPELYRRAGLVVTDVTPNLKVARPGSPAWRWMTGYFLGVMDRLAAFRPFTPSLARSLRRRWLAAAHDPRSLLVSPTVLDVVGQKTGR
jgi:SAM-dependent methyltransferase